MQVLFEIKNYIIHISFSSFIVIIVVFARWKKKRIYILCEFYVCKFVFLIALAYLV